MSNWFEIAKDIAGREVTKTIPGEAGVEEEKSTDTYSFSTEVQPWDVFPEDREYV